MSLFGFLNCDKPRGMTSRDLVNVVQRRLRRGVKVGHAGTLDPMAEGVLVVGVGPAVRLVPYVQQLPKHYRGTFRLGVESESGDTESDVIERSDQPIPSAEAIDAAIPGLVGRIEQIPPTYSAVHIRGKRAYERIRRGEVFEMPSRQVDVYSLKVRQYDYPRIDLEIVCGSGTYIRTIGIDLARLVGTVAVMTHLRRHAIGPFGIEHSVSLQQLRSEAIESMLLSPGMAVEHLPRLTLDHDGGKRLGFGLPIEGPVMDAQGTLLEGDRHEGEEAAAWTSDGQLRAVVRRRRSAWYPYRVFPVPDSE